MKHSTAINLAAILITVAAIVTHSEALAILILAAGTLWAVGFIGSCIFHLFGEGES